MARKRQSRTRRQQVAARNLTPKIADAATVTGGLVRHKMGANSYVKKNVTTIK